MGHPLERSGERDAMPRAGECSHRRRGACRSGAAFGNESARPASEVDMVPVNRKIAIVALTAAVASATWLAAAEKRGEKTRAKQSAAAQMPEQQRALHALNRLTFGPRPGEAQRVE